MRANIDLPGYATQVNAEKAITPVIANLPDPDQWVWLVAVMPNGRYVPVIILTEEQTQYARMIISQCRSVYIIRR